ncbi:MAG: site-specific integrase [Nanoarchaeota archaeon]|nr:site-specific integrase [Nanoarchaeota archaeon]
MKKFLNAVRLPVYKMLFLTMSSTGVRVGECVVLKPENIDFKERCLWVWVEKKERPVRVPKYFPKFYGKKLKSYLDVFSNRMRLCGHLFPDRHNVSHVSLKQAGHIFRQTLDRVGLSEYYALSGNRKLRYFTTNSLRKTFASYQSSLEQARMVLHHANSKITKRHYYATLKERKKEMIEAAFEEF